MGMSGYPLMRQRLCSTGEGFVLLKKKKKKIPTIIIGSVFA
jgi:hypothetical protein